MKKSKSKPKKKPAQQSKNLELFEEKDERTGLREKIENMERWFAEEIRRKEKEIEKLKQEKNIFFNSAIKEADKVRELNMVIAQLRQKMEKMQSLLKDRNFKSKNNKG